MEDPMQISALVARYKTETAAYAARPIDMRADESDDLAAGTFFATSQAMIGVPIRTKEDALAALEFFLREDDGDESPFGNTVRSLLKGLRGYLAAR